MTDLPALRVAVAETVPYCGQGETVPNAWARRERAERILLDAVPALLDEVEQLRADLADWRKGVELIASGLGETNPPDLCAVRLNEKAMTLRADLAAARKVLETAIELPGYCAYAVIGVDAAAWQAWQARAGKEQP